MKVNVYDFDNTIYDGETLVDYIMYFVKTDPKIWKYIPKLLVIAFKDRFHLFLHLRRHLMPICYNLTGEKYEHKRLN